ncbi:uncharacterized protein zgc:113184 isoform X1 [Anguilla anguilla]|uniref:Uncharacterized protein n=1 Tax=Anguilla anguilla TaxID=7936 RepID=A0A9D3LTQ2_ANGAN|nr:uncharacterized protein zgc:113184 isoform X1 [Anguilla anguilla]KAG5836271.1 hypothetical protein ANANG_G00252820 [Anguilla anguilla]
MEEAYEELYREFLRLRSLCLKQAALLRHLTQALAQQKAAAAAPNADPRGPGAVPILCTEDKRGSTTEDWAQAMARLLPSAGQTRASTAAAGDGRAADVIAGGMDRLQLGSAEECRGTETHRAATMGPSVSPGLNREPAPPDGPGDELQPEQQLRELFYKAVGGINGFDAGDGTTQRRKPLWMFSSFLDSEMLSQGGGLMMSEVALHSQVCEFCHAVFPGNTTTRGDFLRHLTAHII